MISNKFRLKHCRFCKNKTLNPKFGAVCGLNPIPPITNEACPEFQLDQEEKTHRDGLLEEAKKYEEQQFTLNYWNLTYTLAPIIIAILTYSQVRNLNADYRWTIGTTHKISKGFSFSNPFHEVKYLHYKYAVNGVSYDGKTKVDADIVDSKADNHNYFVKFQATDPENSEIMDFKMVPYYIRISRVPSNGLSKDSLQIFASSELKEFKKTPHAWPQ